MHVEDGLGLFGHARFMVVKGLPCFLIDYRADIGRIVQRIADGEFSHGAFQHRYEPARDVFLDEQDPRCRAALAGAIECGSENVAHRLLREGGKIDDHCVHAAGLGDEGQYGPLAARQWRD